MNNEIREEQIIFGWQSVDDAARDVHNSFHSKLLEGNPLFLYRATNTDSELIQIVVVYMDEGGYSVGIITKSWSSLYPRVSIEYLKDELFKDLKKWKVEESVVKMYENLIVNRL